MKILITNKKDDLEVNVIKFENETELANAYVQMDISNEIDITTLCKLFKKEVLFVLPAGKRSIEITFNVDTIKIIENG